jgi:hypothetical protein
MARALAGLLVLLVLTGCVPTARPPAGGFTDEQSLKLALARTEGVFPDGLPDGYTVTLVESQDLGDAIVECLADEGFESYTSLGDGVLWSGDGAMSDAEGQAWTLCSTAWQAFPSETDALNDQQLGYLYDYYRESVVPCLALAGITLPDPPTRRQFIESGGAWQPVLPQSETYVSGGFDTGASPWLRSTPGGDLMARCPTWPPEWQL